MAISDKARLTKLVQSAIEDRKRAKQPVWEQLPMESSPMYAHFQAYLALPAGTRTIAALCRSMGREQVASHIKEACALYQWLARAKAYDQFKREAEAAEQRAIQAKLDAEVLKWSTRNTALRDRRYSLGDQMLAIAETRILQVFGQERLPDGTIRSVEARPLDIKDKDLPAFMRTAVSLMAGALDTADNEPEAAASFAQPRPLSPLANRAAANMGSSAGYDAEGAGPDTDAEAEEEGQPEILFTLKGDIKELSTDELERALRHTGFGQGAGGLGGIGGGRAVQ